MNELIAEIRDLLKEISKNLEAKEAFFRDLQEENILLKMRIKEYEEEK